MKNCIIIFFYSCMILPITAHCQNQIYLTHGRIEFEKKVNTHAELDKLMGNGDNSWIIDRKKMIPQFRNSYFNLYFQDNRTLYIKGRETEDNSSNQFWLSGQTDDNVVYNELDKGRSITQKHVFEELFLVKDSARHIDWKITTEMRNIAGFDCRRANGIVLDSIYVVAFYTDAIISPGGPESFTGLPGMILGVALPHEHLSWFATKVVTEDIPEATIKAPVKGKLVKESELQATVTKAMVSWGSYGSIFLLPILL